MWDLFYFYKVIYLNVYIKMHFNFRELEKYGRKVREKKSATHPSTQKQIPSVFD